MSIIKELSIRKKLVFIIFTVTLFSVSVGFAINIAWEYEDNKKQLVENGRMNSLLVSEYLIAPLEFGYKEEATDNLSKLSSVENIRSAFVYNTDGDLFASYGIDNGLEVAVYMGIEQAVFVDGFLQLSQPIIFKGDEKGTIALIISAESLKEDLYANLLSMSIIGFVVMLLAYVIAVQMQKIISRPILKLSKFTEEISSEDDYTKRITSFSNDETGSLYESFNKMLEQLQLREKEKKLAEAEKFRLNEIIENTIDLVSLVRPDGSLFYINKSGAEMLGVEHTNVDQISLDDLYPAEKINTVLAELEKHDIWEGETFLIGKDRKRIEVHQVVMVHKDDDGKIEYYSSIVRDITEQKHNSLEMVRLRNYLRSIIDCMPSAIIAVDNNCLIQQCNNAALYMLKQNTDDITGKKIGEVFPELMNVCNRIKLSMDSEKVDIITKQQTEREGKTVYEDFAIYPLNGNEGNGAVLRIDNVTDRVRIEEMVVQSEKMLSVGGLAAGMAHEINNPLAGIMQTANVMANRLGRSGSIPANEKVAHDVGVDLSAVARYMNARGIFRMVDTIIESGQRSAEIVSNMLSFARKPNLQISSHNVIDILEKALELAATDYDLKKHYDFKTMKIIREYSEKVSLVPCEEGKILQVLLNILRNGAQAMNKSRQIEKMGNREVQQSCFVLKVYEEDEWVIVSLADNGIGMEEEVRKRVFEPFYTTKPVGVGTGLGLSVSYFIIHENHGGELTVESTLQKGTTFSIKLPLKRNV